MSARRPVDQWPRHDRAVIRDWTVVRCTCESTKYFNADPSQAFEQPTMRASSAALVWLAAAAEPFNAPNIHYNTDHGIVRHVLDPASQNTPLHFNQRHLRPPPPRIPPEFDIFIGISAYRDGIRCGFTLFTAFSRATHPDRVHVGVVDQVLPTDPTCMDEYCKLATVQWGECKHKDQITIDARDAGQSQGPTIARHAQQHLIRDEEFCLQLDAHSQVLPDWDTKLVAEWGRTANEMAVLTTYPPGYHMIGPNLTYPHRSASHLCDHTARSGPDIVPFATGIVYVEYSERPQLSAFFGAGLSFSKCHAERRVPVDNQTPWLFFGEESLRSYALWSNGYDFYSPSRHGSVVFHNWTSDPKKARFADTAQDDEVADRRRRQEEEKSRNRVRAVLKLPFHGDVDTTNFHVFYRGTVRSVDAFLDFHGVSNANVSLDQERCHQLHWVPYAQPDDVEKLLPGWYMHQLMDNTSAASNEVDDTSHAIDVLKDQVKQSLTDAFKGQLDAIARSGHNITSRIEMLALEDADQKHVWLDQLQEKLRIVQSLEIQLEKFNDRTTLESFSEIMPALVVLVALALVALANRWRRALHSCRGPTKDNTTGM
ncbi:hypothetical protein DYB32_010184 [Aphanomyces invadans]|uniref:Uncharacterized protein n=1 Tax=Aphanomyces invadans TaxID=157072 RepID=A0A418AGP7_9STRA|nr:hypothetical protein DYB32_010184 [Aphanomyces invadans]